MKVALRMAKFNERQNTHSRGKARENAEAATLEDGQGA